MSATDLQSLLAAAGLTASVRDGMPGAVSVRTGGYVIDLDEDGVYQVLKVTRPGQPDLEFLPVELHSHALTAAASVRHTGGALPAQIAAAIDAVDGMADQVAS